LSEHLNGRQHRHARLDSEARGDLRASREPEGEGCGAGGERGGGALEGGEEGGCVVGRAAACLHGAVELHVVVAPGVWGVGFRVWGSGFKDRF